MMVKNCRGRGHFKVKFFIALVAAGLQGDSVVVEYLSWDDHHSGHSSQAVSAWQRGAWQDWLGSCARCRNIQINANPTQVRDHQSHLVLPFCFTEFLECPRLLTCCCSCILRFSFFFSCLSRSSVIPALSLFLSSTYVFMRCRVYQFYQSLSTISAFIILLWFDEVYLHCWASRYSQGF